MDLAGLASLLTPEGWALLEALPAYDEQTAIRLGEHLREQGHDPVTVAAALTQSRLRQRGPGQVRGVRRRHALHPRRPGAGDPAGGRGPARPALRRRRRRPGARPRLRHRRRTRWPWPASSATVVGVERDDLTAAVATVNLRHWPEASVQAGDVTDPRPGRARSLRARAPGVWLDPSRRTPGRSTASGATRRVSDPEAFAPPWSFVRSLAGPVGRHRASSCRPASPTATCPTRTTEARLSCNGFRSHGEAVECSVWFGLLAREGVAPLGARAGRRTAPPSCARSAAPRRPDRRSARRAGPRRRWLHEPDPAVVAAGAGAVSWPPSSAPSGWPTVRRTWSPRGRRPRRSPAAMRSRTCCPSS